MHGEVYLLFSYKIFFVFSYKTFCFVLWLCVLFIATSTVLVPMNSFFFWQTNKRTIMWIHPAVSRSFHGIPRSFFNFYLYLYFVYINIFLNTNILLLYFVYYRYFCLYKYLVCYRYVSPKERESHKYVLSTDFLFISQSDLLRC